MADSAASQFFACSRVYWGLHPAAKSRTRSQPFIGGAYRAILAVALARTLGSCPAAPIPNASTRRAAVRNGLTDYGMSLEGAERWCDAWELEAACRELRKVSAYWQQVQEWIAVERKARQTSL